MPAKAYDPLIMETIFERMADGESLREICRSKGMPNMSTVMRWLDEPGNAPMREQYARAREQMLEHWATKIVDIADEGAGGDEDDPVKVNRARLRIDTMKWLMSKLSPRKYGDKVEVEHGGKVGLGITKIERIVVDPRGELIEDAVFKVLAQPEPAETVSAMPRLANGAKTEV